MSVSGKSAGLSVWVEINQSALEHNLLRVRSLVRRSVKVMAVVKANAYGHGAVPAAKVFLKAGADYLGVTSLEEALELRESGIASPILVFSPLLPDQIAVALSAGLEQTVCDLHFAEIAAQKARRASVPVRVHVKVDTGMGRLGVSKEECLRLLQHLRSLAGVEVAGLYTHFANASASNLSDARRQLADFERLLDELKAEGVVPPLIHVANSSATLALPESHYNMVRTGTVLYGEFPARHLEGTVDLRESWTLKTRIVALRRLPVGARVGYGSEFTARRPTLAAVLPIGYSDGFTLVPESVFRREFGSPLHIVRRLLKGSSPPFVIVRGCKVPVIGRVSMQMCSVDVTDVPDVSLGDEVIVPARRTSTSARIARVYV